MIVAKLQIHFCNKEVLDKIEDRFEIERSNNMVYVYDARVVNVEEAHNEALFINDMYDSHWL